MKKSDTSEQVISRRKALGRIGLFATAAYTVPAFATLSMAHASGVSSASSGSSAASEASEASEASVASEASEASEASVASEASTPSAASPSDVEEACAAETEATEGAAYDLCLAENGL